MAMSCPSSTLYWACSKLTLTCGSSSSVIFIANSLVVPWLTLVGMAPNPSSMLSPSSSMVSWVIDTLKVALVFPEVMVTLAGTPE